MKTHAVAAAATTPRTYSDSMIPPRAKALYDAKKVPMRSRYTGRRAEQLMNGATKIVARRSLRFSIVRAAMMPGMAQAKLLSMGMKLLPCNPTLARSRSMRNAARAR